MGIIYHTEVEQGSDLWLELRRGILCASEVKNIITPKKLEIVKKPTHLYELAAQRVTGYIEPQYISDDMLRGKEEEIEARILYAEKYAPVTTVGFITNDKWGFRIGYSPDGLIGDDGLIECKSHCQKYHLEAIASNAMDDDYRIQAQTGLMVSERKWLDYISYCGGMPMFVKRIEPDVEIQEKIVTAATAFHEALDDLVEKYKTNVAFGKFYETERKNRGFLEVGETV